eukprot:1498823-Rhodomonas_salina.1
MGPTGAGRGLAEAQGPRQEKPCAGEEERGSRARSLAREQRGAAVGGRDVTPKGEGGRQCRARECAERRETSNHAIGLVEGAEGRGDAAPKNAAIGGAIGRNAKKRAGREGGEHQRANEGEKKREDTEPVR